MDGTPYLLTREQATERYGISVRTLVRVYTANDDFPVVRIGRSVMIHRDKADRWFDERAGYGVDTK